jgi:prolyl 4-hydroxylase
MQRVPLSKQGLDPNFIGSWTIKPLSICDGLVDYFESNKEKQKIGAVSGGANVDFKDSLDVSIAPHELKLSSNKIFRQYFDCLFACYRDYTNQWPFLETFIKEVRIGRFNIQRYQAGQHFQKLHTERSSLRNIHRIFAWMTYLNDVDIESGGSTFFSHYDLEIQPQKGLTLIWPSEWTHSHRGNILKADSKHIITGWMYFPAPSEEDQL